MNLPAALPFVDTPDDAALLCHIGHIGSSGHHGTATTPLSLHVTLNPLEDSPTAIGSVLSLARLPDARGSNHPSSATVMTTLQALHTTIHSQIHGTSSGCSTPFARASTQSAARGQSASVSLSLCATQPKSTFSQRAICRALLDTPTLLVPPTGPMPSSCARNRLSSEVGRAGTNGTLDSCAGSASLGCLCSTMQTGSTFAGCNGARAFGGAADAGADGSLHLTASGCLQLGSLGRPTAQTIGSSCATPSCSLGQLAMQQAAAPLLLTTLPSLTTSPTLGFGMGPGGAIPPSMTPLQVYTAAAAAAGLPGPPHFISPVRPASAAPPLPLLPEAPADEDGMFLPGLPRAADLANPISFPLSLSLSPEPAPAHAPITTATSCTFSTMPSPLTTKASNVGSPHPADNLLQFTDLHTLRTELRDLSFIGSGASANVYSGTWRGMPVAVKFMLTGDTSQLQRQQREAALSRLASHPHLVQSYAVAVAQLTAAHFVPEHRAPSTMNSGHGAHSDLLGTCVAAGDLYGTTISLSRATSIDVRQTSSQLPASPSPSAGAAHQHSSRLYQQLQQLGQQQQQQPPRSPHSRGSQQSSSGAPLPPFYGRGNSGRRGGGMALPAAWSYPDVPLIEEEGDLGLPPGSEGADAVSRSSPPAAAAQRTSDVSRTSGVSYRSSLSGLPAPQQQMHQQQQQFAAHSGNGMFSRRRSGRAGPAGQAAISGARLSLDSDQQQGQHQSDMGAPQHQLSAPTVLSPSPPRHSGNISNAYSSTAAGNWTVRGARASHGSVQMQLQSPFKAGGPPGAALAAAHALQAQALQAAAAGHGMAFSRAGSRRRSPDRDRCPPLPAGVPYSRAGSRRRSPDRHMTQPPGGWSRAGSKRRSPERPAGLTTALSRSSSRRPAPSPVLMPMAPVLSGKSSFYNASGMPFASPPGSLRRGGRVSQTAAAAVATLNACG